MISNMILIYQFWAFLISFSLRWSLHNPFLQFLGEFISEFDFRAGPNH